MMECCCNILMSSLGRVFVDMGKFSVHGFWISLNNIRGEGQGFSKENHRRQQREGVGSSSLTE